MLLNVSTHNPETVRKIDESLGKPFSLRERFRMRGIGSPKLILNEASEQISNLMNLDNNRNVCNIELRPKGIILGFRSLLESYALIIPYYKLSLTKGRAEEYAIHKDVYFVKIQARPRDREVHKFIKKLLQYKNEMDGERIEDI